MSSKEGNGPRKKKEAARRAKNTEYSRKHRERIKATETEAEKAARNAKNAENQRRYVERKKQREAAIAQHQQEQQNSTLLSQGDDNCDSNTTISNRASVPASVPPSDTIDNDKDGRHKHLVELGFNTMMINASLLEKSAAGQQQADSEKFAAILAENRYCFDMIFNEIVGNGNSGGSNNNEVGTDAGNDGNNDDDGVLTNNENRVPNNTCNKNGNAVSDTDGGKGEEDDIVLV